MSFWKVIHSPYYYYTSIYKRGGIVKGGVFPPYKLPIPPLERGDYRGVHLLFFSLSLATFLSLLEQPKKELTEKTKEEGK